MNSFEIMFTNSAFAIVITIWGPGLNASKVIDEKVKLAFDFFFFQRKAKVGFYRKNLVIPVGNLNFKR